jgi:uncharacterized cupin superfamily protein
MTDEHSGYTVVNVKEVEDMAPKFGLSPNLESRFARKPLGLEQSGLSYFRVAPGFRAPFGHTHDTQEEVYLVVSGSAHVKLDEEIVELHAWDAVRIAPGVARGFEAGANGAEIIAFGAPDTDNKDVEMHQDWWTD